MTEKKHIMRLYTDGEITPTDKGLDKLYEDIRKADSPEVIRLKRINAELLAACEAVKEWNDLENEPVQEDPMGAQSHRWECRGAYLRAMELIISAIANAEKEAT